MNIKVAITHTDFRIYWPARLESLTRYLKNQNIDLHIIELAGQGSPYEFNTENKINKKVNWQCLFPNIKIENINSKIAAKNIFKKLDEINPDIVIAGAIAFTTGITAIYWSKINNKKVISFDDARIEDVPRSKIVNYIKRKVYSTVDAAICPSEAHKESFIFWGVRPEKLFVGLNVIDNKWFKSKTDHYKTQKDDTAKELNINKKFILGVGRLVKKKNWASLIKAYAQLSNSHKNLPNLVLIGEGPEKNEMLMLIEQYSMEEQIEIINFVDQEKLCQYYSLAECLILPSTYGETWGLVINEAMASGLYILASHQCGSTSALIENNSNGFVFDGTNINTIKDAILKSTNLNPEQIKMMKSNSLKTIENWDLERFNIACHEAIQYVNMNKSKKIGLIERFIFANWKGRYRPT
ncbi:MAG: hypothetical protein COA79_15720 [Planctomycetota bacterium]|nr:MAG: hypothetical protein COA79_15720 [Planctomycetota bacterium]